MSAIVPIIAVGPAFLTLIPIGWLCSEFPNGNLESFSTLNALDFYCESRLSPHVQDRAFWILYSSALYFAGCFVVVNFIGSCIAAYDTPSMIGFAGGFGFGFDWRRERGVFTSPS